MTLSASMETRFSTKTSTREPNVSSLRTTLNTESSKVATSQESFGDKDDDDAQSNKSKIDPRTRSFLTALELATIFEDCVDTLTALSSAVAAPTLDIRTASSIMEDEFFNRPRFSGKFRDLVRTPPVQPKTRFANAICQSVLPPISMDKISANVTCSDGTQKDQTKLEAVSSDETPVLKESESKGSKIAASATQLLDDTLDAPDELSSQEKESPRTGGSSTSVDKSNGTGTGEIKWIIKQHYMSKVYKRTWQSNKETPIPDFEEVIKSAGLRKTNPVHKQQLDMAAIKYMMADIFNELIQLGTMESLHHYLDGERAELNKLSEAFKRLVDKRVYSRKLRAKINETRLAKKRDLQVLKMMEHKIEDDGQELRIRTTVENIYTTKYVDALCKQSLKKSTRPPEVCVKEINRIQTWIWMESLAHDAMMVFLKQRMAEISVQLEYWVDKYETDKERLLADLEELKEERAAKAARKLEVEAMIRRWMPVIKDDRRIRKIEQGRQDYMKRCHKAAIRIQARWRGHMVRSGLGRFANILTIP